MAEDEDEEYEYEYEDITDADDRFTSAGLASRISSGAAAEGGHTHDDVTVAYVSVAEPTPDALYEQPVKAGDMWIARDPSVTPTGPAAVKNYDGFEWREPAAGEKGDKGDKGDAGAKGATGNTGAKGATGNTGAKGDTGAAGAKGDPGTKGNTGAKGDKGDTGAAGTAVTYSAIGRCTVTPDVTLCSTTVNKPSGVINSTWKLQATIMSTPNHHWHIAQVAWNPSFPVVSIVCAIHTAPGEQGDVVVQVSFFPP